MPNVTPWLWFDTEGEEAAEFYTSVFPNSKIVEVTHYGSANPQQEGTVMTVTLSFQVLCADQDESDTRQRRHMPARPSCRP
jgi:predicted 3-demethylubiquinone-9 3-methyltransferase (glyoxalase superfamily)